MRAVLNRPRAVAIAALFICSSPVAFADAVFEQTNLASDIPGLAPNTDPNLANPWGVSFSATSPFWVSDQMTNVSTLYNASGVAQALVVSTPGGPTGQVFNSASPAFTIGTTGPATFIFSTLSGNIEAWNSSQGTTAATVASTPGAVYTGLTLGTMSGSPVLYAANKATGKIDVFNSSFNPVTLSGSAFADPAVPVGLTPYNIQLVNGNLYVEYSGAMGAPGGFVAEFDQNGTLIQNISDPHLDAPWGIVMAPSGFGAFGDDLLIGNELNGEINAFDPSTGAFLGTLDGPDGNPIVNTGLWALGFRNTSAPNGNTGDDPNALYFVAGINGEKDGLFGKIDPVPEPATFGSIGLILFAGVSLKLLRRLRS